MTTVNTLRGVGGNVIYCEEAASMNKNVFFRVVVPLLEVVGTALICISTPLKKANFYSELCDLKDQEGVPVFNVIQITLFCEKCAAASAKKGEAPKACLHVINRLPPWKDGEKHGLVKMMFEQVGRGGDYDRESRGMVRDDGDAAFQPEWIDKLRDKKPYQHSYTPKYIITTCDPNGGGSSSDTALISAFYHKNKMVICGIDSHPTQRDEKKNLVISHIKALRRVQRFKNTWIIFIPENNLDDAARITIKAASTLERVHIYINEKKMEGAKTGPWTKIQYTERATDYLMPGCVYFDKDIVCANPYKPSDQRLQMIKPEFIRQLRQWRKLIYADKTAKGTPYVTCSGKTDDAGQIVPGQKDDMAMTFVFNAFFSRVVEKDRDQFPKEIFT